ncbi:MAG: SprB repeat-containing protein, partial [Vampirovibrionales bacterium]
MDTLKDINVTQPDQRLALNSGLDSPISCPGGSDGYIELSASGGTPGYEYSRDKVNWVKSLPTVNFSSLSHSDSTFFARDTLGCLDTLYHAISQPNPIRANEQITNVTCFGDSNGIIDINLSGGTPTYSIVFKDSEGNTSEISDFNGSTQFIDLKKGEYSLKITDKNNCVESKMFSVEQPLLPLSLAVDSAVNPTCFGLANGVVHLKPTGGWGSYTFSHGTTESNVNGLFNTLRDGTNTFSITDAMGCVRTIDTTLTQPTKLERQSITVTSLRCNGDGSGAVEVVAKGGTPSYKYDFGLGLTKLGARSGLMGGKLPFIIRDSLGCELNDTATIPQPEKLKALISSRNGGSGIPSCSDSVRILATGGTTPYSLSILGDDFVLSGKGFLFYDQPNGRYPLVISDGNGCLAKDTANISNLPKPEFRKVDIFSPSCANTTDGRV